MILEIKGVKNNNDLALNSEFTEPSTSQNDFEIKQLASESNQHVNDSLLKSNLECTIQKRNNPKIESAKRITTTSVATEISPSGSVLANDTAHLSNLLTHTHDGRIVINKVDEEANAACKFNGYSNHEILIMFLIALLTCLLFYFRNSQLIYHNALLPFFSFEIGHLIFHFKCLPVSIKIN